MIFPVCALTISLLVQPHDPVAPVRSPADEIAPHGDPRDQGWKLIGEEDAPPARPKACTREYRPVCGRDGRTYPNACEAARAEVEVRGAGACRRNVSRTPPRAR